MIFAFYSVSFQSLTYLVKFLHFFNLLISFQRSINKHGLISTFLYTVLFPILERFHLFCHYFTSSLFLLLLFILFGFNCSHQLTSEIFIYFFPLLILFLFGLLLLSFFIHFLTTFFDLLFVLSCRCC